jgi:hypothetical protein
VARARRALKLKRAPSLLVLSTGGHILVGDHRNYCANRRYGADVMIAI